MTNISNEKFWYFVKKSRSNEGSTPRNQSSRTSGASTSATTVNTPISNTTQETPQAPRKVSATRNGQAKEDGTGGSQKVLLSDLQNFLSGIVITIPCKFTLQIYYFRKIF